MAQVLLPGNPTTYRGCAMTWNGRQLATLSGNGVTASYKYDADGLRTTKTVNGVTSTYVYSGGKLMYEKRGDIELYYYYSGDGQATGLRYITAAGQDLHYYFTYNWRGDIVGIYTGSGLLRATYQYDAWGKLISIKDQNGADITSTTHVAWVNPLRYRGYYYDSETGLYYVSSRYYDPETCRFINADCMIKTPGTSVLSTNMFAYCENNPVNRSDSSGQWFGLDDLIAGAVGAVVGVASQFVSDVVTSVVSGSWQFSSWQTYVGAGIGGAIGGVTTLYAGPVVGAAVGSGSSTLIGQSLENVTGGKKRSVAQIAKNTAVDATIGAVVSKVVPIKVSGITAGRNSMDAVFKSGLTKLGNQTASRMSAKVLGKGLVSSFVSDLGLAFGMGAKSYFESSWEQYIQNQTPTPTGPCYWCAP